MTKILIAEDSPTQAEQLKHLLEQHNYNVVVAKNGREALSLVNEHKPSLIISDIQMPEMNGFELCKSLKANSATRNITVVLLTSLSGKEDVLEGIDCGADSFITKPYSDSYLVDHIEQILTAKAQNGISPHTEVSLMAVLDGKRRIFNVSPQRMFSLLISTYEAAINKNQELIEAKDTVLVSEEKFRNVFENTPIGKSLTSFDGKLIVNKAYCDIVGYSADELSDLNWEKITHPDDIEESQSVISSLFAGEKNLYRYQKRYIHKSGKIVWTDVNMFLQRNRTGKPLYFITSISDITERKEAEEALIQLNAELESANRAKSEFLANMSHEIRTPMNAVLGYADLLGPIVEEKTQKDYIESIKSSGRGLLILINDILDLSKIEAGKLELNFEFVNSKSFFSEFERIFSFRISEKGLKFILDIASGTPAGIYIDETRLRQILFNLIGNAVKFTENGHIKLKAYTENPRIVNYTTNKSEEFIDLVMEIEDTGIGISREFQNEIFEPFTQAHLQKQSGGTGLGLTITRRLVSLMKGTINLQSEVGKGSTFRIKIPDISYLRDFEEHTTDIQIDPANIQFEKATIIVADDVEHNRKYLIDAMKNTNITIVEAEDGLKAFNMAKKIVPDLIFADIRMPNLDGFGLLSKIKGDKTLKHIPMVAYSASVMKDQKERIHKSQFSGLLIKPVQVKELFVELMNHLPYKSLIATQPDKTVTETKFTKDITDLPSLIHTLETVVKDTWETFATRQPIEEIKEFGNKLEGLGKNHNAICVTDYGEELVRAADSFNIEAILKLIREFPRIVEKLKNL